VAHPGALHIWITTLPQEGRYVFTREEAEAVADASPAAVRATLRRLKGRGAIVSPRRGFYVLVPAEYRTAGSPPASWFIHDLMQHLGRRYYVALLTAAALHGAAHQQPMVFQVITNAPERRVHVGRVRIEFHVSNLLDGAATASVQTDTGSMVVATPETTAFDIVRFPWAAGYWSNIATVLIELAEALTPPLLAAGAQRVPRATVQRLGWLLDMIDEDDLAKALEAELQGQRLVPVPLNSSRDVAGAPLDPRWRVLVNDDVEPDL